MIDPHLHIHTRMLYIFSIVLQKRQLFRALTKCQSDTRRIACELTPKKVVMEKRKERKRAWMKKEWLINDHQRCQQAERERERVSLKIQAIEKKERRRRLTFIMCRLTFTKANGIVGRLYSSKQTYIYIHDSCVYFFFSKKCTVELLCNWIYSCIAIEREREQGERERERAKNKLNCYLCTLFSLLHMKNTLCVFVPLGYKSSNKTNKCWFTVRALWRSQNKWW